MGAVVSGCCEPDHPRYEDSNMQRRRGDSYSMTSGDESEAPPNEIANYQGRTMSEIEFFSGFKRAVIAGNAGLALYFVKERSDLNIVQTPFDGGDSCLHVAVRKGHHGLVSDLLKNGASPDAQNEHSGDTPLHTAVRVEDLKMVTLLLGRCNPWMMNQQHETALTVAQKTQNAAIIRLLDATSTTKGRLEESKGATSYSEWSETETMVPMEGNAPAVSMDESVQQSKLHQHRQPRDLPELKAFLQKNNGIKWQKRWVVVKEQYMLWNDVMRNVENVSNEKERRKWTNYVDITQIGEIKEMENDKAHRSFTFEETGGSGKEYVWKCANRRERQYWIEGIKKYQKYYGTREE